MKPFPRILLGFAAIVLAAGVYLHTAGFNRISAAVAKSDLEPFIGKGLKVLWLQDSTISIVLAIAFAVVAVHPSAASKSVILLLALVPIVTAALLYRFIGNFIGGHLFFDRRIRCNAGRFFAFRKQPGLTPKVFASTPDQIGFRK